MTPSSSCEGLSPTGSTCSLGMVGHSHTHVQRTHTPSYGVRHSSHSVEHGRLSSTIESSTAAAKEDLSTSAVMMDAAIVKAVPSLPTPPMTSPDSSTSRVNSSFSSDVGVTNSSSIESPLRGLASHSSTVSTSRQPTHSCSMEKSAIQLNSSAAGAKLNGPPSSAVASSTKVACSKEELTSSWKSPCSGNTNGSNWADDVVSNEEAVHVNCPEWATMSPSSACASSTTSGIASSPASSKHATPSSSSSSSSGGGGGTSVQHQSLSHSAAAGAHHHSHHPHHSHHAHHPSSPQTRTVHQIHSSSSSDIIPIQTNPGHSSPFHSPPSSSNSFVSTSSFSSSSSNSVPSHSTNTSQHPHPTASSTTHNAHSTAKHKQAHTPIAKRNSSEMTCHSSPVLQALPAQQVFLGGNRTPNIVNVTVPGRGSGGSGGHSWIVRPVLLPNHPTVTMIGVPSPNRTQHHQVIHSSSPAAHNGLMRTVPPQNRLPTTATIVPATLVPNQAGGLVVCPPMNINHMQGAAPPAMCFNCGKRGHLGNSCPGVTMETNNPASKIL